MIVKKDSGQCLNLKVNKGLLRWENQIKLLILTLMLMKILMLMKMKVKEIKIVIMSKLRLCCDLVEQWFDISYSSLIVYVYLYV